MDINQQYTVDVDGEFIQYLINEGFFGDLAKSLARSVPRRIADSIRDRRQAVADKANQLKNIVKHGAAKTVQKVTGDDKDQQQIEDLIAYIEHHNLFGHKQQILKMSQLKDAPYGIMPRAQLLKI